MARVEACTNCGECLKHCPYQLDTPALLKREYEFYKKFVKENC
jgi:Fe-S oxidoreductase